MSPYAVRCKTRNLFNLDGKPRCSTLTSIQLMFHCRTGSVPPSWSFGQTDAVQNQAQPIINFSFHTDNIIRPSGNMDRMYILSTMSFYQLCVCDVRARPDDAQLKYVIRSSRFTSSCGGGETHGPRYFSLSFFDIHSGHNCLMGKVCMDKSDHKTGWPAQRATSTTNQPRDVEVGGRFAFGSTYTSILIN